MDLGSKEEGGKESPALHSTHSFSSSKFNKCFLKKRVPSSSSSHPPRFLSSSPLPFLGITHFVPSTVNDDYEYLPDVEGIEKEVKENTIRSNENGGETSTVTDHINIFLDPEFQEEKVITLCGSIDENDYSIGQIFLSYKSSIRIELKTKPRKLGQIYEKRRGYKFNYEFIPEQVNYKHLQVEELMSITSVTRVEHENIGRVTSLNFPYAPPKGVRHKTILRCETGSSFELRITKSMVHLLRNGSCNGVGEQTALTVKDYFGDISLYPPIPNIWSICLTNKSSNQHSERHSIQGQIHGINRIKSIKSNFHLISIESTAIFKTPFLFFYKFSKG